ncbi:MAG: phosphoribosylformylglycinamidine cyclo-ligase, partial [Firmicutes bacterium]|nr:phosphoribosylformylglycinamidine cyclo-ligase [Bacillota bacterium]
ISHITGGGFYENVPRSIPDGLGAKIKASDVKVLPVFKAIQAESTAKGFAISDRDMFNTFNMGVGMVVIVPAEECGKAVGILKAEGIDAYRVGEIVSSEDKIILE